MSYEQPIEDVVRAEKEERAALAYGKVTIVHMDVIRAALEYVCEEDEAAAVALAAFAEVRGELASDT